VAVLTIPEEGRRIQDEASIRQALAAVGIEYERWDLVPGIDKDTSSDAILAAYARLIERVQQEGGFTKVDVVNVHAGTPGLEAMLAKFSTEHWHEEDEVRFTVHGRGLYHIHPPLGPVLALEVAPGDLLRVPRSTRHWFTLCGEREIKAVRFFQDPAGWAPYYTESRLDEQYEPVCFGPSYVEPEQRVAASWPMLP
jgi:1,2-dihydroxy-3-keto-5-methylthiopentene dioxygenase